MAGTVAADPRTDPPTPDPPPEPPGPPAADRTPAPPAGRGRPRVLVWARGPGPDRVLLVLTWLAVAVGTALRVRQWAHNRSFWLDELFLLRAMRAQRFDELLQPLGFDQSAPPGWLAVQHVLLGLTDGSERGARLLPLVLGVGGLMLVAVLGRTVLGGPAALVATVLVALNTKLVIYSAEFKQYSADVFFVTLVVLLAARLALRRSDSDRARIGFGLAAAVAVWFSHAGALAAGGAFLGLGLLALAGRRWRELLVLIACSVPYAAGLGLEYVTLLSANADNAVLLAYWGPTFPPDGPLTWSVGWEWFRGRAGAVTRNPLDWPWGVPLLLVVLGGLVALALRVPRALLVLLLPFGVLVAAGLAGSYPIANRLALWVVPLAALTAAAALDLFPAAAARAPRPVRVLAAVAALVVLAPLVPVIRDQAEEAADLVAVPRMQEESRQALELVARERRPGDLVLVDGGAARHAGVVYAPRLGITDWQLVITTKRGATCTPSWFGTSLRERPDVRRVWLLYAHTSAGGRETLSAHLERFGPIAERLELTGAGVFRFDRAAKAPAGPAGRPGTCLSTAEPASVR